MFEDLKDKISELKDISSPTQVEELNQYLREIGRYEQIKSLMEIKFINDILLKFSAEIEAIDNHLLNDSIDDSKSVAQRKMYEGQKRAYLDLISQFNLPNLDYIAEELKHYE